MHLLRAELPSADEIARPVRYDREPTLHIRVEYSRTPAVSALNGLSSPICDVSSNGRVEGGSGDAGARES